MDFFSVSLRFKASKRSRPDRAKKQIVILKRRSVLKGCAMFLRFPTDLYRAFRTIEVECRGNDSDI